MTRADFIEGLCHPFPSPDFPQRCLTTFLSELDRANIISVDVSVNLWTISASAPAD